MAYMQRGSSPRRSGTCRSLTLTPTFAARWHWAAAPDRAPEPEPAEPASAGHGLLVCGLLTGIILK